MFCPRLYLFLVQVTGFQSAPILKELFHSYFSSIFYKKVNQLLEGVHLIKIPKIQKQPPEIHRTTPVLESLF